MNSVDRVLELCKKNGISVARLERECGFGNGYLKRLKSGMLPADRAQKIADFFGVSMNWLILGEEPTIQYLQMSSSERQTWAKYKQLSAEGRSILDAVLKYISDAEKMATDTIPYPYIGKLAAAGGSVFSDDIPVRVIQAKPVLNAELIVGVNGDSMEPTFHDGDLVYVERTHDVQIGEIGIFQRGNEFFIKELSAEGLVSHNKAYEIMTGPFLCVGKVLGVVES